MEVIKTVGSITRDEALAKKIKQIENGMYTFNEVYNFKDKEEIEKIFIEKLEKGALTDPARSALIRYECEEVINGRKDLEDIPEIVRAIIEGNENYMNYINKNKK